MEMVSVPDIFLGLFLGLVAAFFVATMIEAVETDGTFHYEDAEGRYFDWLKALRPADWGLVIAVWVICALAWFLPPIIAETLWGFNVLLYVVIIVMAVAFVAYGIYEVSSVGEVIPFVLVSASMWFFLRNIGGYLAVPIDPFMGSVVKTLPLIVFVLSTGIYFARWLFIRSYHKDDYHSGAWYRDKILAWITKAIAVVMSVIIAWNGVAWGSFDPSGVELAHAAEEAQEDLTVRKLSWEDLENLTVEKYAGISQVLDDRSFTPWDEQRKNAAGIFSDPLSFPITSFAELEESMMRNPSVLETYCDFFQDKKIGSKRVGDINPWMGAFVAVTKLKGNFIWCEYRDNSDTIYVTDTFRRYGAMMNTFLERFVCQGEQDRTTIENWCLSATSLNNERWGEPSEYQYDDKFLVFAYVGKNERGNASATGLLVFGVNPSDQRPVTFGTKPETVYVTGTSGGGSPSGGGGGSDEPQGTPDSDMPKEEERPKDDVVVFDKDKTKGIETAPGEADENTIDLSDPEHSAADTPDGSTSENHGQYREDMERIDSAKDQRTGGDSNESTTEADPGTTVDQSGAEAANNASQKTNGAAGKEGAATKTSGDGKWGTDDQIE